MSAKVLCVYFMHLSLLLLISLCALCVPLKGAGCLRPFVSLDTPWCFDFGKKLPPTFFDLFNYGANSFSRKKNHFGNFYC